MEPAQISSVLNADKREKLARKYDVLLLYTAHYLMSVALTLNKKLEPYQPILTAISLMVGVVGLGVGVVGLWLILV